MQQEIFNQNKVQKCIIRAFETNSLANAYLFIGEQGVGKSLIAQWFAQYINTNQTDVKQNQINDSLFKNQDHPDFIIVKPEKSIKIDQIKEVIERLNLKPTYAQHRIVFIKDADLMTIEATNAFLKTLEEPPNNTIIILSTKNKHNLLPTILSRCQTIYFELLSTENLDKIYSRFLSNTDEKKNLIHFSNGSVRKDLIRNKDFFLELQNAFYPILSKLHKIDSLNIIQFSEEYAKKDTQNYLIELILIWFIDLQFFKWNMIQNIQNQSHLEEFKTLSRSIKTKQISFILKQIVEAEKNIKFFSSKQLIIDGLLLKIMSIIQQNSI